MSASAQSRQFFYLGTTLDRDLTMRGKKEREREGRKRGKEEKEIKKKILPHHLFFSFSYFPFSFFVPPRRQFTIDSRPNIEKLPTLGSLSMPTSIFF